MNYKKSGVFRDINTRLTSITDLAVTPFLSGCLLSIATILVGFQIASAQAAGTLDTTFGTNGVVVSRLGIRSEAYATKVQPDGKIVVAGYTTLNAGPTFTVARYGVNGGGDSSFNGGEPVFTLIGVPGTTMDSRATSLALQPDGKIVVAGTYLAGDVSRIGFAVVRYNANGTLDTSFGNNGITKTLIGTFSLTEACAVAVQPDGRVVVAGYTHSDTSNDDFTLVRYTANGALDTTFGSGGIVITPVGSFGADKAYSVVIQPDGKILAAGEIREAGTYNFALVRYNSNGTRDTTFGTSSNGIVTTSDRFFDIGAYSVVLQPDGKIVAAGKRQANENSALVIIRFNTNGSYDTTFGNAGFVSTLGIGATAVAIQSNGKIVATGSSVPTGTTSAAFTTIRVNPNGSFDTAFGSGGKAVTPIFTQDFANAVAIQPDGRIVVAGTVRDSRSSFGLVRYFGDSTAPIVRSPFDFDGDGKTDLSIFRPAPGEWWYLKSSTGADAALQFGSSSDKLVPADYTGDGKTDIAYWRPATGEWYILRSENFSFYAFPFGANGDVPQAGDFDADGKGDQTIYRPSTSTWYTRRSTDGIVTIQGFGVAGDVPVAADYDGDGKADIAIYRTSLGQWWIKESTAGNAVFQFGTSSDKPVAGDYTGDGKTDVAFYRPSTGEWYVLRSEDLSYYSFPFGAAGDVPSPGDYDGDGKFDAAIFRPSSSTWYVKRSTAGTLIQGFGQSGDKPVPNAFVP